MHHLSLESILWFILSVPSWSVSPHSCRVRHAIPPCSFSSFINPSLFQAITETCLFHKSFPPLIVVTTGLLSQTFETFFWISATNWFLFFTVHEFGDISPISDHSRWRYDVLSLFKMAAAVEQFYFRFRIWWRYFLQKVNVYQHTIRITQSTAEI